MTVLPKELAQTGQHEMLPSRHVSRSIIQATILQMQQDHGNVYVQHLIGLRGDAEKQANRIQLEDEVSKDGTKPPALEETGIGSAVARDRFVSTAREIKDNWADYKSGKDRAKALGDAANEELKKAGVPACKLRVKKLRPGLEGELDFATWTLVVSSRLFEKSSVSDDEMANAAETVYHEARHAEQWYRMAQLMASQKKSAGKIVAKMGIPYKIAKAAVKDPLKADSPQKTGAESWYESVYGAKSKHREKTLKALEKLGKLLTKAKNTYKKYGKTVKARIKKLDALKAKLEKAEDKQTKAMVDWIAASEKKETAAAYKLKVADKKVAAYKKYVKKADMRVKKAEAHHKKLREALLKAYEKHKKAHKAYKELPEEADAWKVGEAVEKEMKVIVIEIDLSETKSP